MKRESLNGQNQQMTLKPGKTSGRFKVTFIHRHHIEPRKEETFLIPLKYMDVTRSTHTDLDVLQEKEDGRLLECRFKQALVRFVETLHAVHFVERKTSQGTCVESGERLTTMQTTTRPDHVCPEVWTNNW